MEIVLDAGIAQASLFPREDIKCGKLTNEEVFERVKGILEYSEDNKNKIYMEINTLRKACENLKRSLNKYTDITTEEKMYIFSLLSKILSEAFYLGVTTLSTPEFDYQIGIIYVYERKENHISLSKYDFQKNTQEILKNRLIKSLKKF